MKTWFKVIWYMAIVANIGSFIWFILGSTANFQRRLDLVGLPTLIVFGLPSIILVVLSVFLIKYSNRPRLITYAFACLIIFLLLYFISPMVEAVKIEGWLTEHVQSDPIKITSDGMYEYRIELINTDQRNSYERLYLKNIETDKEMYIPVDINTDDLSGITIQRKEWAWVLMTPTDKPNVYELSTTKQLRMPQKKFLIDVSVGTSQRLE